VSEEEEEEEEEQSRSSERGGSGANEPSAPSAGFRRPSAGSPTESFLLLLLPRWTLVGRRRGGEE